MGWTVPSLAVLWLSTHGLSSPAVVEGAQMEKILMPHCGAASPSAVSTVLGQVVQNC